MKSRVGQLSDYLDNKNEGELCVQVSCSRSFPAVMLLDEAESVNEPFSMFLCDFFLNLFLSCHLRQKPGTHSLELKTTKKRSTEWNAGGERWKRVSMQGAGKHRDKVL